MFAPVRVDEPGLGQRRGPLCDLGALRRVAPAAQPRERRGEALQPVERAPLAFDARVVRPRIQVRAVHVADREQPVAADLQHGGAARAQRVRERGLDRRVVVPGRVGRGDDDAAVGHAQGSASGIGRPRRSLERARIAAARRVESCAPMDERPWLAHYDAGVPADVAPVTAGVPALLQASAREFAERPALHFQNRTWTHAQLARDVESFAHALVALGAGPRSRVAIMLPNLPQAVIAYQAALRIGCEVVLTNPLYMDTEVEHQWNDAQCTLAVVADFLYVQKLAVLRARVPVRTWILARIPDALAFPLSWIAPFALARRKPPAIARRVRAPDVHDFRELLERGASARGALPALPALDELAVLQYTGGTTGKAKAAELTHQNLAVNLAQIQDRK
ncbi:MAG: hypothetical protein EPO68_07920, partial [Planctomycetota bacterium]